MPSHDLFSLHWEAPTKPKIIIAKGLVGIYRNWRSSQKPMSTPASAPNLITVKETAEYLRIPLPTVYYLVQRGQIPAVQIGGRWRVKKDLLDRDILRNEEASGQPT